MRPMTSAEHLPQAAHHSAFASQAASMHSGSNAVPGEFAYGNQQDAGA